MDDPQHVEFRPTRRIIVGITGATGVVYGLRVLEMLRGQNGWETHLVVSQAALLSIREELPGGIREIEASADVVHNPRNIGAAIASGSFVTEGMIVAPCSMKTLAAIAHGLSDALVSRAADVVLKERRRLVLMVRETPLTLGHIRNMAAVTEMGGVIFPPVPAFYTHPTTLSDVVDHSCMRVLDLFGIRAVGGKRWAGLSPGGPETSQRAADSAIV